MDQNLQPFTFTLQKFPQVGSAEVFKNSSLNYVYILKYDPLLKNNVLHLTALSFYGTPIM